MKDSADIQLPDRLAGFREDRSCTDQITILRIIVEQSVEGNSSLYINFIDHEKAFDIVDGLSRTVFGDKRWLDAYFFDGGNIHWYLVK
ncbi:unnamed protein product [Schistosoma margrebowiei]|uniref:Uncharacterized protein n=1 Tax=Schistosoma margrebowiei TaxID=48269 RepID=A0A183MHY8_9TREM|nr:unnamed protein product [Schistosoma margrebowiei]